MNLDFLAVFGTIIFIVLLIALFVQLPIYVWAIAIFIFILLGNIKNAK